jgi:large subunit ribosomal protein L11
MGYIMAELSKIINIFIRSQMAESGPPLGTVLGNLGLNAVKFCKEFNEFTQDLPIYFLLKVKIFIYEDKSFTFFTFFPAIGSFLNGLRFERLVKEHGKEFIDHCISLRSVVLLAKLKFPLLPLEISVPIICGSVFSANLIIV